MSDPPRVVTVGHSAHPIGDFLSLLAGAGVATLVDVRSIPYSRRHPQFRKERLQTALSGAGIGYRFEGDALGGRPSDDGLRDVAGRPDHDAIAATPAFTAAIRRLLRLAGEATVAIMCAEADPLDCHRRRLVTPALQEAGAEVVHLLRDGRIVTDAALDGGGEQLGLL